LRIEQREAPELIANARIGLITRSALALIATFNALIAELETALSEHFEQHPDAKVVLSLPGLRRSSVPPCWATSVMTGLVSRGQSSQGLRRHVTCDQDFGAQQGRAGPLRPQPAPRRRLRPVGLCALTQSLRARTYLQPATSFGARRTIRPSDSWPTGSS